MNEAHVHLVVNHMPIVGLLIGILILIMGLLLKRSEVKLTALGVLIFSAITSIFAFYSGDAAEDVVENMAGISKTLIEKHEELGETFFTLTLILGAIALIAFIAELKKVKFAKYLVMLVLIFAIADMVLAKFVGTSGGEIMHIEIRGDSTLIPFESDGDD